LGFLILSILGFERIWNLFSSGFSHLASGLAYSGNLVFSAIGYFGNLVASGVNQGVQIITSVFSYFGNLASLSMDQISGFFFDLYSSGFSGNF
jgi:hypothetical protein